MMLSLLTNLPREILVQQIKDGLILLVLGMGTVFIFLILLVCITKLMSRICAKLEPETTAPAAEKKPSAVARPNVVAKSNDAAVAAAIAAAYDKER